MFRYTWDKTVFVSNPEGEWVHYNQAIEIIEYKNKRIELLETDIAELKSEIEKYKEFGPLFDSMIGIFEDVKKEAISAAKDSASKEVRKVLLAETEDD